MTENLIELDLYSVIKQKYIERDVLDKIRAEIEDLRFGQPLRKLVVDECLEIIDKYKAESSDGKSDTLDKIKGYVEHIRNTGMGKQKSLEFIEKFIEGLKAESEE